MTLIEELEQAAKELECDCSAPRLCSRGVAAARLRKRAAHARKLQEQARTNPGEPGSFDDGWGFGVHALTGDL